MAFVAAAAAQAAAIRQREEEEQMTPYSPTDLAEHWEFKIIRSATGKFRDPAFLKQTLDEEARAGWMFLEKFDDSRVRLKRAANARQGDLGRSVDPYRTFVGPGSGRQVMFGLALGLGVAALLIAVALILHLPARGR